MKNLLRRVLFGAAIIFASMYGVASAQSSVVIDKTYSEVYHTRQATVAEVSYCSATAIGPLALLTATHCELGTDEIVIQGKDGAPDVDLKIERVVRDNYDHTIMYVSPIALAGYVFPAFASVDLAHKFGRGDDVFLIGNPHGFSNIFRKGYVSGSTLCDGLNQESIPEILIDVNVGEGDSGAGIFDSNGVLIGVVTGIEVHGAADESTAYKMPYALVLNFTPGQIQEAASYGVKK